MALFESFGSEFLQCQRDALFVTLDAERGATLSVGCTAVIV